MALVVDDDSPLTLNRSLVVFAKDANPRTTTSSDIV
jgi:hypothetical protein